MDFIVALINLVPCEADELFVLDVQNVISGQLGTVTPGTGIIIDNLNCE